MPELKSSMLKAADKVGNDLVVEFKNGRKYLYKNVPEKIINDLLAAESAGKFLNAEIKQNYQGESMEE